MEPSIDSIAALDSPLHEQPLSSGQAQILALARLLLHKDRGNIVILDEATSSLDVETDTMIQSVLARELKNHTIISVAHRFETIMDADVVVVLDEGKIIETGSPQELLSREEAVPGAFANLAGRG